MNKQIHYLEDEKKKYGTRDDKFWVLCDILSSLKELEAIKNGYTTNCEDVGSWIKERFETFKESLNGQGSVKEIIDNIKLVSVLKNIRKDDSIYYQTKVSIQGFHTVTETIEETKIGIKDRVMFEINGGVCRYLDIQKMCLETVDENWRDKHNELVKIWEEQNKIKGE
jgi:hypothetical protein